MKRSVLVLVCLTILVSLVAVDYKVNGDFRTRFTFYKDFNVSSSSIIDSRAQMQFTLNTSDNAKFVYMLRSGDIIWGDNATGGGVGAPTIGNHRVNVQTRHAYLDYTCPVTDINVKIGLQPWYDHRSLVLDDDFAAIMLSKDLGNGLNIEGGFAVLEEAKTTVNKTTDNSLFLLTVSKTMNDQFNFGGNVLFERGTTAADKDMMQAWIMPYCTWNMDALSTDVMAAYNYGKVTEGLANGDDITNGGVAATLKLGYDLKDAGKAGINVLYSTGDDGSDPKSTTSFNTISSYHVNGLEYLGVGINDTYPSFWFDANNGGLGIMSIVGTYAYPFNEKFTGKFAAGIVNSVEKRSVNGKDESNMGTEIDLGGSYKLYDSLAFDFCGAYVLPGDYYKVGTDSPDNVYEVSGVLNYGF